MKSLYLTILCLILTLNVFSQLSKQFYLEAGYSNQIVQDKGHSPLSYQGDGLFFGLSSFADKTHYRLFRGIQYGSNSISSGTGEGINYELNRANRTNVLGHYGILRKTSFKKIDLSWGAQLSGMLDYIAFNQKANNLIGYELNFTLNPAIHAEYGLNEKLKLSFSGNIPVLGYSIRPEALGLFPMRNFDLDLAQILTGGSLVSLHNYFSLSTRTSLHFPVKHIPLVIFYDYSGGVNNSSERKAYSTNKIGLQIPLVFKLKKQ
jgi:hypothetical protein